MANPIMGADSLLDSDTVTVAPAEDAAFPATNLSDDKIWSAFKPGSSATTVDVITDAGVGNTSDTDYFMLVGHDLFDPANDGLGAVAFNFAHSLDGVAYTTIFSGTPIDNKIILRTFTQVVRRFRRLRLTRGTAFIPTLGELQWGTRVEFPHGVEIGFDPQEEDLNSRLTRAQFGNRLGAVSTFQDRMNTISIPLVLDSFIRGTTSPGGFQDFWDNHATLMKAFVFAWNPGNPGSFETDAYFATLVPRTKIQRPLATPLDTGRRDLSFSIEGLKE